MSPAPLGKYSKFLFLSGCPVTLGLCGPYWSGCQCVYFLWYLQQSSLILEYLATVTQNYFSFCQWPTKLLSFVLQLCLL